jgi:hypothetical protein
MSELDKYTDEVVEGIEDAAKKVLKEAKRDVTNASPKRTGAYSRDWAVQFNKGKNKAEGRVYNKDHYRLTHLLEHGHVIRNGTGRTYGRVDPSPPGGHIGPVNEQAQRALEEAIKEVIANG